MGLYPTPHERAGQPALPNPTWTCCARRWRDQVTSSDPWRQGAAASTSPDNRPCDRSNRAQTDQASAEAAAGARAPAPVEVGRQLRLTHNKLQALNVQTDPPEIYEVTTT